MTKTLDDNIKIDSNAVGRPPSAEDSSPDNNKKNEYKPLYTEGEQHQSGPDFGMHGISERMNMEHIANMQAKIQDEIDRKNAEGASRMAVLRLFEMEEDHFDVLLSRFLSIGGFVFSVILCILCGDGWYVGDDDFYEILLGSFGCMFVLFILSCYSIGCIGFTGDLEQEYE